MNKIAKKWPNIRVQNKKMGWKILFELNRANWLDFFGTKSIIQPQLLLITNRRLLFCLIVRKEEWHFV